MRILFHLTSSHLAHRLPARTRGIPFSSDMINNTYINANQQPATGPVQSSYGEEFDITYGLDTDLLPLVVVGNCVRTILLERAEICPTHGTGLSVILPNS